MGLLVIGFVAGIVVAFLLRTLLQYERDGLARVHDAVSGLEERTAWLEERIQALEAIAVGDEPPAASESDMRTAPDRPGSERRTRP